MSGIAAVRYSTGKSLQQDLIKINVETASVQKDVIELSAEKDAAVARLKTVLGRPIESPLTAAPLFRETGRFLTGRLF